MFEKASKFGFLSELFENNLTFNKYLLHVDDVKEEIWWQILLSTEDLEYSVVSLKLFWEHGEPDPNFQVNKIANTGIFTTFFYF